MSKRDEIFSNKLENITPFRFNDEVANAFDDMVERSIPNYNEIHKIIIDLVTRYYPGTGIVYDLGCSTGTTIQMLEKIFVPLHQYVQVLDLLACLAEVVVKSYQYLLHQWPHTSLCMQNINYAFVD